MQPTIISWGKGQNAQSRPDRHLGPQGWRAGWAQAKCSVSTANTRGLHLQTIELGKIRGLQETRNSVSDFPAATTAPFQKHLPTQEYLGFEPPTSGYSTPYHHGPQIYLLWSQEMEVRAQRPPDQRHVSVTAAREEERLSGILVWDFLW